MYVNVVFALITPMIIGFVIIYFIWGIEDLNDAFIAFGNGYFIGWGVISILVLKLRLSFYPYVIYATCFSGLLLMCCLINKNKKSFMMAGRFNFRTKENAAVLILAILFIGARIVGLYFEVILIPLLAWDAWLVYLHKGVIWYQGLIGFPGISTSDISVQSNIKHYNHFFASTVAFWMAVGLAEWDDAIIFLPWLLCPIASIVGMVGFMRKSDVPWGYCMLFSYAGLTLPIINTHMVLSGYLDIWISSVIGLASASLYYAAKKNNSLKIYCIIIINVFLCCIVKEKAGVVWAINIILIVVYFNLNKWSKIILPVMLLVFFAMIVYCEILIEIYEPLNLYFGYRDNLVYFFYYRAKMLFDSQGFWVLLNGLFVRETWNLFWYYFVVVVVGFCTVKKRFEKEHCVLLLFVGVGLLELIMYALTSTSYENNLTHFGKLASINRGFMHIIMPALLLSALCAKELIGRRNL